MVRDTIDRITRSLPPRTESHREAISEANIERWRKVNSDRDVKIVERYTEGNIGYRALAEEFSISYSTLINVMRKAKAVGAVVPRSPGTNIKHGG